MDKDFDILTTNHASPFKVPEGYFDNLTERVMTRIPQNEVRMVPVAKQKPIRRWRPYAAAAAVVAVLFGVGVYIHQAEVASVAPQDNVAANVSTVKANAEDSDFEAVADYIMCDDYDLYAYISNE